MKTTRSLLFFAVVLALATAAGCAATPQDRWFQQREALNTANRVYLAHVPVMTDEQIVHYGELLQTARAQLDQAKTQLPEGGPTFDTALDTVEALLTRVIALGPGSADPAPAIAPGIATPGHVAPAPDLATLNTPNTEDTPDDTR